MYMRGNNSQSQSVLKWKGLDLAYLQPPRLPICTSETMAAANKKSTCVYQLMVESEAIARNPCYTVFFFFHIRKGKQSNQIQNFDGNFGLGGVSVKPPRNKEP